MEHSHLLVHSPTASNRQFGYKIKVAMNSITLSVTCCHPERTFAGSSNQEESGLKSRILKASQATS